KYSDKNTDLEVRLEAMTPYIPLDTDRSSYPATIMKYRLTNTGNKSLSVSVEGWSENPGLKTQGHRNDATLLNETFEDDNGVGFFGSTVIREDSPPAGYPPMDSLPDYGSIALYCCDMDAVATATSFLNGAENRDIEQSIISDIRSSSIAGVSRDIELAAGKSHEVSFIIAWHYPNVNLLALTWADVDSGAFEQAKTKRWYASKYKDAKSVVLDVAENLEELTRLTRLWRDNWYDSTLPHWLLERSIIPTNALQTNTAYRFEDGRFWAWEGVGCCPGTCTHVWHYAQAVGRLFPDLERDLRERTDYGLGFHENGAINFRGDVNGEHATDGQAGVILRTYREHQMSSDDAFLRRVYPNAKKALEFLISQDAQGGEPTGITKGEQHNTLDAEWYGKVPVLASLYLAALRAGEEMAKVVGDGDFAQYCQDIHSKGEANIAELFDENYGFYIQEEDPKYPDAIGVGIGCYIDQTMGQWWANQLGLGRLYDGANIRKALASLWDYNFVPDMGILRESITDPKLRGRPYAIAGDAGLVMCTWPKGGRDSDWEKHWQYGYFNECMTGFEYEAAGHMVWESDVQPDLLVKGLAISRSIHDRYHAGMRNPYNEIECSDHYARAMASYGVFLAAGGFEYDGPKGHIGFKPRMTDDGHYKSAFTSANGWGSFQQKSSKDGFTASIDLAHGELKLKTLALRANGYENVKTSHGTASLNRDGEDVILTFDQAKLLKAGETLKIQLQT
ncbi:MAG: hypothetical protein HOM01_06440, partial [Kordiimonadaceae bacterium]|nr:hypothetical protein [Kordiimonadaceae bacterium]